MYRESAKRDANKIRLCELIEEGCSQCEKNVLVKPKKH